MNGSVSKKLMLVAIELVRLNYNKEKENNEPSQDMLDRVYKACKKDYKAGKLRLVR